MLFNGAGHSIEMQKSTGRSPGHNPEEKSGSVRGGSIVGACKPGLWHDHRHQNKTSKVVTRV